MKNRGVIIEKKEQDFLAGTIPYKIQNQSGDWTAYLPAPENQYSHFEDSMACVTYSILNVLETQYKFKTGKDINFSDRFIAKLSGTTHQGNSVQKVLDTIRKYGLVLEEEWPAPKDFTWNEYYAPIPAKVIALGRKVDLSYEFHSPAKAELAKEMKHVPLELIIEAFSPNHSVMMVNQTKQFDQYPPHLRPLQSIHLATKIVLNNIEMNQTKVVLGKDGKTVFKAIPVGTDFESFKQQCAVEGIEVPAVIPPASSL